MPEAITARVHPTSEGRRSGDFPKEVLAYDSSVNALSESVFSGASERWRDHWRLTVAAIEAADGGCLFFNRSAASCLRWVDKPTISTPAMDGIRRYRLPSWTHRP